MSCEIQPARHNRRKQKFWYPHNGKQPWYLVWIVLRSGMGPNGPKMPVLGQTWPFLGQKSISWGRWSKTWLTHIREPLHYRLSYQGNWKLRILQNKYLCSHFLWRELFQIWNIWFYLRFLLEKLWQIFVFFKTSIFTMKGCRDKTFVFLIFFPNTWFLFLESFNIIWPALPVFWPKSK